MADSGILGADFLLRLGIDASGVSTELSSKLTAVERQAVAQGKSISNAYGQANDKVIASQLKVVAAQERVNRVMAQEKATLGQRASAQASLISTQSRYRAELDRTAASTVAVGRAERGRLSGLAGGIVGGFAAGGALSAFDQLSKAKDAAVELQDVLSANDVLFGRARQQITEFERINAGALNLSRLQTEQLTSTFGGVLQSAGANQADAVQQGLALTQRAADVRSFKGGRIEDVAGAFRSALVGETEPIRRYGVLLDDARLRQRAFTMGLIASTKEALTPAQKAQAAYTEILAQTASAQGDVARTADSAANKLEDAKQRADDARAVIGTGLLPVITELATVAAEVAPALAEVGKGIGAILGNDAARRGIELGLAAAAIAKISSAVGDFASRSAEKIGRNVALARSYDAVATSAGRAAIAEGVESRTGVLGRNGIAGATRNPRLLGLGLAAGAAGATGLFGGGALGAAATIGGTALAGAEIGSLIAPGIGTAVGAVAGGIAGAGLGIFGPGGKGPTTTRTPAEIQRDLAGVNAELEKLRGASNASTPQGVNANLARGSTLLGRQNSLSEELKAAQEQGRQTFQVFDQGTGKIKNLTQAEIAAASAAAEHAKQLEVQRKTFADLRATFDVADPFAKAGKDKALDPQVALRRLTGAADRRVTLRRDFATIAGRGASREELDAFRGLEESAPGTVHRIAQQTGRGFVREVSREMRRLGRQSNLFAHMFDDAPDEAVKAGRREGRRLAEAAYDAAREYFAQNEPLGSLMAPTPGVSFPATRNNVNRRRRQP